MYAAGFGIGRSSARTRATGGGPPSTRRSWTGYERVAREARRAGPAYDEAPEFLERLTKEGDDPVPVSISYDKPVPLHLMGCSLWGAVELASECGASIIDEGTVFINRDCSGFIGDGAKRDHRIIEVGTPNPRNRRIVDPYVVDRRHVPGTEPPTRGRWEKGDAVINIDPDPAVPKKAVRGWICVEPGEPGRWVPYGALVAPK